MAYIAEKMLRDAQNYGEWKLINFEYYVTICKEAHKIPKNIEENGYKWIYERSKVRFLIVWIKTPDINKFKNTILTYANYCQDVDACVTIYKYYIKQVGDSNLY